MADVAKTLEVLLREYPQQLRLLRSAQYEPPKTLRGCCQCDSRWSYAGNENETPINHFTLAEAVFSHNQMAYVLVTCMAQDGLFENVT